MRILRIICRIRLQTKKYKNDKNSKRSDWDSKIESYNWIVYNLQYKRTRPAVSAKCALPQNLKMSSQRIRTQLNFSLNSSGQTFL
jgi:hypothetical protein